MSFIKLKSKTYYHQIINEWLEEKKGTIKETSYYKYKSVIEVNIIPILGNRDIHKLTDNDIYNFFSYKDIVDLSDSTKRILYIIINSSIKYCVKNKYIKSFPKLDIKIKQPKAKIVYFTRKEQSIFEMYLNKNMNLNNLGLLLDLYTGLRIGELCALQWEDVDFVNNTISVTKTVQRIKNTNKDYIGKTRLVIIPPKTEHSIRTIPIPKFLIKLLRQYKTSNNIFIFSNSSNAKDIRTYEKYFDRVLKRCGIKSMNFHSLRHTFATRSRESGMDIKILSELLGHASYKITLDIYVHTSIEFKKDSVNTLVKYLKPKTFLELNKF